MREREGPNAKRWEGEGGGARPPPLLRALWPGLAALAAVALLIGSALGGLVAAAPETAGRSIWADPYVRSVIGFTLLQAGLSALVSVAAAVPVARALARRDFPGRTLVLRLFGLPMIVPALAGAFGILALFGRSGWLNQALGLVGVDLRLNIYGLAGIVIAHAFFNMPLAIRILVGAWGAVPAETWRLAAMLGMSGGAVFRLIEAPLLRQALPGIFTLTFLLCAISFAIVLTLGGGPASATLEVAIYQAIRFDFDLARAVALSGVQVALCAALVLLVGLSARRMIEEPTFGRPVRRWDGAGRLSRGADALVIGLGAAFVLLPLAAIAADGIAGLRGGILERPVLWAAAGRSLAVALSAGLLALVLGWSLAQTVARLHIRFERPHAARALDLAGTVVLTVPPLVLGAGLFVLLRGQIDVLAYGLWLVVPINAAMALPFVLRLLTPAAERSLERHGRLADSLGITGWHRLRLVDWPALRRPAGLALALAVALSFGDLGAIALFGNEGNETLPLYLSRLLGAYRQSEAAAVVLLLLVMGLALFLLIERGVGGRERG